jgi:hypothetical protein
MLPFLVLVPVLTGLNLAIEPNSSALALEPLGAMAGMAAAIYGTSFFAFGALAGSFISRLLVHGVLPLMLSYFVLDLGHSIDGALRPPPASRRILDPEGCRGVCQPGVAFETYQRTSGRTGASELGNCVRTV